MRSWLLRHTCTIAHLQHQKSCIFFSFFMRSLLFEKYYRSRKYFMIFFYTLQVWGRNEYDLYVALQCQVCRNMLYFFNGRYEGANVTMSLNWKVPLNTHRYREGVQYTRRKLTSLYRLRNPKPSVNLGPSVTKTSVEWIIINPTQIMSNNLQKYWTNRKMKSFIHTHRLKMFDSKISWVFSNLGFETIKFWNQINHFKCPYIESCGTWIFWANFEDQNWY